MKHALLLCASLVLWASEDEAAKSQRARELVAAGKLDEAIPIYQELARAHPNDAAVLANLSIAEFKARRFRDAANDAASAVKLQPDSLPANLILGSSYLEMGEPARAVTPLERVLAIQPRERNALLMLAESLFRLGRYEEAAVRYENAGLLAPESPKVWYGLGRTYEALADNAFRQIETASPYWQALQADLFVKQRRYGSAYAHYQQALKEVPVLPGAHAALAIIYQRTGHSDWALVEERRERQSKPDCTVSRLACDFAAGRFHEIAQSAGSVTTVEARYWVCKAFAELAAESYGRLAQLPSSLETHLQKAKTLDGQGLSQEAGGEWREALHLSPDDLAIGTALAWSLFRAHDFHAALPVLAELLRRKGDSAELNFLNGATLVNLGEPDKAIPPLETAARVNINFLPAQAALGQALLEAGRPKLAIPHLKVSLAADDDASAHFRLFRAYQLTGQTDLAARAKVEYQSALKLVQSRSKFEEGEEITAPVP
jgi:tetratricopeptide (TPR) repeat protein